MKDRRLVYRLSRADPAALRQIYNWYKDDLPAVAMALLADPENFAKLCRRYYCLLVAPADSILLAHHLAEEAVQKALAAACHQLPKLKSYHCSIRRVRC